MPQNSATPLLLTCTCSALGNVAAVELVYVIVNFDTLLLRFVIFDHVLSKDRVMVAVMASRQVTSSNAGRVQ